VVLVDALDGGRERRRGVRETDVHMLGQDGVARLGMVGQEHRDRPVLANDPDIDCLVRANDGELLGA
jgi:hypothetical protein